MKETRIFALIASAALLAGCAASAPTSDDSVKFHASDRAISLIEEQGKATAAMLGYADNTDLVCERFYKVGSHITTSVCMTRAEAEQRRLNHQEEFRGTSNRSALCVEGGTSHQGFTGGVTLSNRNASC